MFRFELPDIGEGVVEAEVIEWHVREGEAVALDQVLVELMTDKANIEIPSPRAGRVHRLCFEVGQVVPVGAVLIEIDDGDAVADSAPVSKTAVSPVEERAIEESSPQKAAKPIATNIPSEAGTHPPEMPPRPRSQQLATRTPEPCVRAVPAVRALAKRLGVDLEAVVGSGPGGRVMRSDIEALAGGATAPLEPASTAVSTGDPTDWERRPLRGLRRAIAQRMVQSRRTAAHFTYVEELDVTKLMRLDRESAEGRHSLLAFIACAVVRVLPDFPTLNASIDDARGELIVKGKIHLGIATATADGLLVPVIEDAVQYGTDGLAERIAALAEKARSGKLALAELKGSTFTITSLGKLGGIASTPILNWPESAVLGVNKLRSEPRYIGDALQKREVVNLSISVDHRIADGLEAAEFIRAVGKILEEADFPELSSNPSNRGAQ